MAKPKSPNDMDVRLGNSIRQWRLQRGLSQERLAEKIGVSFQQVQKYERAANRVSFSKLCQIASALKMSIVDLVGQDLIMGEDHTGANLHAELFQEDLKRAEEAAQFALDTIRKIRAS
ncbi:MAG: helix-turn-helix transcriptional regulator [Patescibacteria group bacterium]